MVMALHVSVPRGTPFQMAVWKALLRIPRGQVVTYRELAKQAGHPTAIRAVASAVGKNPLPVVIPCHRVVRSDGTLGGYSGPGGVRAKWVLLRDEGVTQFLDI